MEKTGGKMTNKADMTDTRDTIGNILAYVAGSSADFGRTKLVKTSFFADLVYYNLYGEFVTDDRYIVQQHGPMGRVAGELTMDNSGNGYIHVSEQSGDYLCKKCIPVVSNPSLEGYSEPVKNSVEGSRLWIEPKSAAEVSEITHNLSIWDENRMFGEISKENFRLSPADCEYLKNNGIVIGDFGRKLCSVTNNLPDVINAVEYAEIDDALTQLTKMFPVDMWGEWDDCFLACADAVREVCRSEKSSPLLRKVCEYGGGMAVALAFAPNLDKWVTCVLDEYTVFFDKTSCDAAGAMGEINDLNDSAKDAVDSLMTKLRNNVLN